MRRVLFVDDDANVLAGLERMLRPYRHSWTTFTAIDGETALQVLATTEVDVIVSDMRMPRMDGAELLTRVRENHPEVVRIVLSGQMDGSASLRTASVAHQFLSKPCSTEALIEVIQRSCDLRSASYSHSLRRALGHIGSLPSPGTTIVELNRVMASGDVDLDEVGAIVSKDPAITAKVLQLVNSAFFGLPHSVADIRMAITYLGVMTVRNLFVASDVFRAFDGSGTLKRKDVETLQARAVVVASTAADLSAGTSEREWAFLAGLVHDIGILALACCPAEVIGDSDHLGGGFDVVSRIEAAVGAGHADVGAYLLTMWGLPDIVVDAVARHHTEDPDIELSAVAAAVRDAVRAVEGEG